MSKWTHYVRGYRDGSREGKAVINGRVISRLSLMARLLLYPSPLKGGRPPPAT